MASGIEVLVAASPTGTTTVADINARLGLPDERLAETCREESRAGRLVMLPGPNPLLLLPETLAVLERDTVRHVTRFHEESPLQRGMPREELRARVSRRLPPEVFAFCLHGLERARVLEVKGDLVALHGRDVRLDAGDDRIRSRIEEAFARAHFQPPLLSELGAALGLPEPEVRRIYFWMLEQRLLVRITDDMAYPNAILDAMKAAIRRAYPPGTRFGVAEFKEIFDLTRKHAIPLLEFLDRERFTRRQGNDRVVL
jgi:selenocysteine-specific elongation factor